MNKTDDLEYFSVKEVARLLKVSPRTIYKFIAIGMLRGQKIARKWRISREQFDAFIKKLQDKEYPRYVK